MGFSINELAQASGLTLYPDPGPFNSNDGTLIGFKRKFLFAVGVNGADSRISVMVRFKGSIDREAMLNALKADAAMKKMYTICDIKLTGSQSVVWSFGKPIRFHAQTMALAIDSMASVMNLYAQGFDADRCEGERCNNSINVLTLANGIPNLMCESCKSAVAAEQETKRQQYERRAPRPSLAILYGTAAAVLTGLTAGMLMWWDMGTDNTYHPKFFIALTAYIALGVAWCVKTGIRNVTYASCVLATVLTAGGKFIADVLFFTKYVAVQEGLIIDYALVQAVAENYLTGKWEFSAFIAIFDFAIVLGAAVFCWGMRPKFTLIYRTLAMPAAAASQAPSLELSASAGASGDRNSESSLTVK